LSVRHGDRQVEKLGIDTPNTVDCSQRAIAMLSEYIRQRASVSSLFR
jgi:hypothetical protein